MKFRRIAVVAFLILSTVGITNFLSIRVVAPTYSQSYPAVVCPPTDSLVASQVSTASTNTPFRKIAGKATVLSPIKTTRYVIKKDAILLDQNGVTSVTWQSLSGIWAGASLCMAPQGDQWFVGGSADVTSKGRLFIVNSGLSEAIVDVEVWGENGVQSGKVLTVPANSSLRVALDSIAAGQALLAMRVTSRSGRVNAFLIDERGKGLQSLGGDLVAPDESPLTDFVISGIPHQIIKGKGSSHVLRILVPGSINANIRVDLISSDGTFAPIGLDGRDVQQGRVVDVLLKPTITATVFSLRIRSDQPVLAGVFSSLAVKGHKDFMWNSITPQLEPMTLAVKGLSPTLVFSGDSIRLVVSTRLIDGSVKKTTLKGSDVLVWKPPEKALSVSFSEIKSGVTGAGLISSTNGVGTFPLILGSALTRAAVPLSNIGVINR